MKQNVVIKIVLLIFLSLLGFLYLILLGGSTYEALVFPQSPQKVTLAQAVQMDRENKPTFLIFRKALYISITDAVWECASVKQVVSFTRTRDKSFTDAVFTDAKRTAIVFVQVDGLHSCQDLTNKEVPGKLHSFTRRPVEYKSDTYGLITIEDGSETITLSLCTHCTPSEARLYPMFFLAFPFLMWLIFEFGRRQQQKRVSGKDIN